MKRKEGWCQVYGRDVWIENGKVLRGIREVSSGGSVTTYPYKYNRKTHCWDNAAGISVSTLRRGLLLGYIGMF